MWVISVCFLFTRQRRVKDLRVSLSRAAICKYIAAQLRKLRELRSLLYIMHWLDLSFGKLPAQFAQLLCVARIALVALLVEFGCC